MWDLPGAGLEPVSPALAGGFLTTAPPGKPQQVIFVLDPSSEQALTHEVYLLVLIQHLGPMLPQVFFHVYYTI